MRPYALPKAHKRYWIRQARSEYIKKFKTVVGLHDDLVSEPCHGRGRRIEKKQALCQALRENEI